MDVLHNCRCHPIGLAFKRIILRIECESRLNHVADSAIADHALPAEYYTRAIKRCWILRRNLRLPQRRPHYTFGVGLRKAGHKALATVGSVNTAGQVDHALNLQTRR